jgi:hypothetical protein
MGKRSNPEWETTQGKYKPASLDLPKALLNPEKIQECYMPLMDPKCPNKTLSWKFRSCLGGFYFVCLFLC